MTVTAADLRREVVSLSTRKARAQAESRWTAFLRSRGRTVQDATGDDAAAWYAELVTAGTPRWSMETWRSGVRALYRGGSCPLDAPAAREAWRGVLRIHPRIVRSSRALSVDELMALLGACDEDTVLMRGARDAAALALGFAAALRCGELSALDVGDVALVDERRLRLHIRRSKTDQTGRGQIVPVIDGRRVRAVERVRDWIEMAGIETGPLFRAFPPWLRGARALRGGATSVEPLAARLGYHGLRDVLYRRADEAGVDRRNLTPHSLRAGFVTSTIESGAAVDRVMSVTRHRRVETLMDYVRRADDWNGHAGEGVL